MYTSVQTYTFKNHKSFKWCRDTKSRCLKLHVCINESWHREFSKKIQILILIHIEQIFRNVFDRNPTYIRPGYIFFFEIVRFLSFRSISPILAFYRYRLYRTALIISPWISRSENEQISAQSKLSKRTHNRGVHNFNHCATTVRPSIERFDSVAMLLWPSIRPSAAWNPTCNQSRTTKKGWDCNESVFVWCVLWASTSNGIINVQVVKSQFVILQVLNYLSILVIYYFIYNSFKISE